MGQGRTTPTVVNTGDLKQYTDTIDVGPSQEIKMEEANVIKRNYN